MTKQRHTIPDDLRRRLEGPMWVDLSDFTSSELQVIIYEYLIESNELARILETYEEFEELPLFNGSNDWLLAFVKAFYR